MKRLDRSNGLGAFFISPTVWATEQIMPDKVSSKDKKAQQARSQRYGISVRDDGNVTKPSKWESVSDSQWGDPVNYMYPVPDKAHAANAKSRFTQNKGEYDTRSRAAVMRRLNRLLRKYGLEPMKSDEETEDTQDFNGLLIGRIQLEDEGNDEGGVLIPAARLATFNHPWYGKMFFDEDLFESFIDNWQSDVLGTQLAIDAEHRRNGMLGGMALGWIDKLELNQDDGIFYIHGQPTDVGKQHLGNTYKYASIEYDPNFKDQETGIEYGPVLIAVAATNHPFVHRNPPMVQNESPTFAFGNVEQTDSGVYYYVWPSTTTGATTTANTSGTYITIVNDAEEAIDDSESVEENISEESTMPDEKKPAVQQPTEQTPAAPATPPAARVEYLELPDGTRISASDVAQMQKKTAMLAQNLKDARISEICGTALDRGVAPVVVNCARQYLSQLDMDAENAVTLDTGEPNEAPRQLNQFNAVAHLLSLVPGRIGEVTYTNPGQQPQQDVPKNVVVDGKDDMTLEEAEELARKRRKDLGIDLGDETEL
jgi:hypothetical protein